MKRSNYNRDGLFTGTVSVPQTMLKLMSKLAQARGYSEGILGGINWSDKEHIEEAVTQLSQYIGEACEIEKELRVKLRTRGEDL